MRFSALVLCLLSCAWTVSGFAQSGIQPASIVRFTPGEAEWTGRLETAINTYSNADGVTLDLVAAIHIADVSYYENLNRYFATRDKVLYELVAAADTRPARDLDTAELSGLSFLQRALAGFLALRFQLQEIDYGAANFVHADMSPEQLQQVMSEKNESFFSMVLAVALAQVASLDPDTAREPFGMAQIMAALATDNKRDSLKYLLASELARAETLGIDPALESQLTLLGDRNRVALQRLQEVLADPANRSISLFYGAAHLPGLERAVLDTFGFEFLGQRWLAAWSIPQ